MFRNLTSLALTTVLLCACGGGGGSSGGDTGNLAPAPLGTFYLDGVTIPSASYASGSAELGGWTVLQQARKVCGFGELRQDTRLDAAAKLHAQYQTYIASRSIASYLSHYEEALLASDPTQSCNPLTQTCNPDTGTSNPYYRGLNLWDRTQAQGYGTQVAEILEATTWDYDTRNPPVIPTLEQRGAASMRNLLNTVYHLTGALYEGADIGFAVDLDNRTTGFDLHEEYRFGVINGYQNTSLHLSGADALATYPCEGSSTVPSSFIPAHEQPNPFPAMTSTSQKVGPPIYLKVERTHMLSLSSASIVGPDSVAVPLTILNRLNDPAQKITYNETFVIPNAALLPGSSYQVRLSGTISLASFPHTSAPFSRNFTLRTAN